MLFYKFTIKLQHDELHAQNLKFQNNTKIYNYKECSYN